MNKILLVVFAVTMVTLAVAMDIDEASEPKEQEVQQEVNTDEEDVVSSVNSAVQTINKVFARPDSETAPQTRRIHWGHVAAGAGLALLLGKKRTAPEELDLTKRGFGDAAAATALLGKRGEETRRIHWGHVAAGAGLALLLGKKRTAPEEPDLTKRGFGDAAAATALLGKRGEETRRIHWGHVAAGAGLALLLGKKRTAPEELDLTKRGFGDAAAATALLGKRGEETRRIHWGHVAAGAGLALLLGKKRTAPEELDLTKRGLGDAAAATALLGKRGEEEPDLTKRGFGDAAAATALLGKRGEEEPDLTKRGFGDAATATALLGKRGEEGSKLDAAAGSDQKEFHKDVVKVQQALDVLQTIADVAELRE